VRVSSEIRRTFPKDPPIIGGLALKEEWNRGVSDYTDNSGPASFYGVSTGTPG
jgi:hypothetical protein